MCTESRYRQQFWENRVKHDVQYNTLNMDEKLPTNMVVTEMVMMNYDASVCTYLLRAVGIGIMGQ